ncbi:MAG: uracil-DNA glycosylase [Deltaproteobacteria bacterium]|nr:uracil-DNA glycosylase [Deltaproteobacteria bacterium]MBW2094488.1 uracil-DNA glycosylase [Deltaproteobacteria bacterium]
MAQNYRKPKAFAKECKWYPVCPMKTLFERGYVDAKYVELYCKGNWEICIRYQMEENGEYHPDWMLPDGRIDERLHEICKRVSP